MVSNNEIGMLERWAGLLDAGANFRDSVERLSDIPEYSEAFKKIAEGIDSGGNFQDVILENRQYFSEPTVMLSRAGEFVAGYPEKYYKEKEPLKNLSQNLSKAKDLLEIIEKHKPETKKINEILLCYSLGGR